MGLTWCTTILAIWDYQSSARTWFVVLLLEGYIEQEDTDVD